MHTSKTKIKTKVDYNVQLQLIIIGVLLLIVGLYLEFYKPHRTSFWWLTFGSIIVLIGFWNVKTYEISENYFKTHRFLGLITKQRKMNELVSFNIKEIDFTFSPYAFFILAIYAKRSNYLRFRLVKLKFTDGKTMRINENYIKGNTLNKLLQEVKKQIKNR